MKIDIYSHITPQKFIDTFSKKFYDWEKAIGHAAEYGRPTLNDVEARLRLMDTYDDYVQVLVPSQTTFEPFLNPQDAAEMAMVFNDATAELVNKYPDKFIAAAAVIPQYNLDAAIKEIDRTIGQMGFKGILIRTPIFYYEEARPREKGPNYDTIRPIDIPEFIAIYEKMAQYDLPIWIHPEGQTGIPVYPGEKRGKYGIYHVLGWPIESAIAMSRLVCSGVLRKYPNLKFIIHHCGSGIVPALGNRIANEFDKYIAGGGIKFDRPEDNPFTLKNAADYYKMFYADTALYGGDPGGLMCGHSFFGPEHVVFATDFPFDMAGGDKFIQRTIESVYRMSISDAEKQMIFEGNAQRVLHLDRN